MRYRILILILFLLSSSYLESQALYLPQWGYSSSYPQAPDLFAEEAILLDWDTQTVLYEKNADFPAVPASLTKLITFFLAYRAQKEGKLVTEKYYRVPVQADASLQASGSSLMFLSSGQKVRLEDLFKGLLVSSGNDAAMALAILISGSETSFVQDMNTLAQMRGYQHMVFFDSSGLSERNRATAREWVDFSAYLLRRWPEIVGKYFSLQDFSYPIGNSQHPTITQRNRNPLLGIYEGADGIKTGHTEEAGYTFIASAQRSGRRLIAVLLMIQGSSRQEGCTRRKHDAQELLDWGFDSFSVGRFEFPIVRQGIAGGHLKTIELCYGMQRQYTLPKTYWKDLSFQILHERKILWAPVYKNQKTAIASIMYKNMHIVDVSLIAAEPAKVSMFKYGFHAVLSLLGWRPEIYLASNKILITP